ncbi:MAG: TetR/AcrR family transcriptional regulator [Omnitrophica WOR_2 bacterium]
MLKRKSPRRKYNSTHRQMQADKTKMQVAEAARNLFFEHGYLDTTIDAIANKARVSRETVYSIFRNKQNILGFLLDVSMGGDDFPLPIIERPEPQAILQDTDQKRQINRFAQEAGGILSQAASVFAMMQEAANTEPEISKRVQHLHQERLENMISVVHHIAANGPLRDGLDQKRAGETVWALTSPELFNLLTVELGWTKERYSEWLSELLTRALLP